jgi:hypothetical protein
MSLKLHPDCQQRLVALIADIISGIAVKNNLFPSWLPVSNFKECDNVLPPKERDKLESYVGHDAFATFVNAWLYRDLKETFDYKPDAEPLPLIQLSGFEDSNAVAKRLVGDLCTLPWSYAITIRLPGEIGKILAKAKSAFNVADHIIITTPDDKFDSEFPFVGWGSSSNNSEFTLGILGNMLNSPTWEKDVAHLQIHVKGFIGEFGATSTLDDGVDTLKEFFGLGTALGLFTSKFNASARKTKPAVQIHRKIGETWQKHSYSELDAATSKLFQEMTFEQDQLDENEQVKWFKIVLPKIAAIYSEPTARRLRLAAHWLFDSDTGSDELLSYVQAAVAMETLLGDQSESQEVGIGQLIKNRCAYLIGDTLEERNMLLHDIPTIYKVRSKIVHNGQKRLNSSERDLFYKLQWICHKVIRREVAVIMRPVERSPLVQRSSNM